MRRWEVGPDGAPARLIGVVRDVTGQHALEARARHAARRFADLAALAAHGRRHRRSETASSARSEPAPVRAARRHPRAAARGRRLPPCAPTRWSIRARLRSRDRCTRRCRAGCGRCRPAPQYGYRVDAVPLLRGRRHHRLVRAGRDDHPGRGRQHPLAGGRHRRLRAAPGGRAAAPRGTVDELTRLPNRAACLDLLDRLLAGPDRDRVAVVCGGLDDFQRVNSSLGHEAGDDLLVTLAGRLQRDLPVSCTAARLSGDEFVVICADHAEVGGPDQLAGLVADLLRTVITVHGRPVDLTASVGLATPVPTGDVRAADLLRFAEAAMLDVKRRQRRGGIAVATDGVVSSATRALELEAELQAAIAADGLVLEYQPVVGPGRAGADRGGAGALAAPRARDDPARRVPAGRPAQRAAARAGPVGAAHGRGRGRRLAGARGPPRPPSPSTSPGCCRVTPTSPPR